MQQKKRLSVTVPESFIPFLNEMKEVFGTYSAFVRFLIKGAMQNKQLFYRRFNIPAIQSNIVFTQRKVTFSTYEEKRIEKIEDAISEESFVKPSAIRKMSESIEIDEGLKPQEALVEELKKVLKR